VATHLALVQCSMQHRVSGNTCSVSFVPPAPEEGPAAAACGVKLLVYEAAADFAGQTHAPPLIKTLIKTLSRPFQGCIKALIRLY
jgi:hypothetical protein